MDSMCEVRPGHPDLWGSPLTGNIVFCFNLITFLWYYFDIFTHKYNIYIHILHSGIVTFTEVNDLLLPLDNNSDWDCYSYTKQSWSHTDTVNNKVNIYQINKQVRIFLKQLAPQTSFFTFKMCSCRKPRCHELLPGHKFPVGQGWVGLFPAPGWSF